LHNKTFSAHILRIFEQGVQGNFFLCQFAFAMSMSEFLRHKINIYMALENFRQNPDVGFHQDILFGLSSVCNYFFCPCGILSWLLVSYQSVNYLNGSSQRRLLRVSTLEKPCV